MTNTQYTTWALSLSAFVISAAVTANSTFSPRAYSLDANMNQTSPLPKRYIVKFNHLNALDRFQPQSNAALYEPSSNEIFSHYKAMSSISAKEIKQIARSNSYSVKLNAKGIQALKLNAHVEYIEEDVPRRFLSETTPWGETYVGATKLSDSQTGNRTICIIDSGYDRDHSDLKDNKVTGTNNSGTGNWYEPGNNNAHGTHVAGTIAAIANNHGVIGVMPNQHANIHVIKVFNESGWGYSSSLVSAVDTCVRNDANIVTMSLGGGAATKTERNALEIHANNGILLIAASGNDGNNQHSYPASYDSVMSVAAVDSNKDHAAFSQYTNQVEISAPGEAILSTVTVGEGRLADITSEGKSYFAEGIVPHNRYVKNETNHIVAQINGSVTAELAECTVSGSDFHCDDMNDKICLVERVGNQIESYPEINAITACYNAGAKGVIVYSNTALPGLQNPFLIDVNNDAPVISVSVSRATGQHFHKLVGSTFTLTTTDNEDYQYYNGTSMAAPHVSGVATLIWSQHPECSAAQIRTALNATAEDLGTTGRDDKTGYGLIDAVAAKAYLDESCDGPTHSGTEPNYNMLVNGIAKTSLAGTNDRALYFSIDVPIGASNLTFTMTGGTGDADMYVQYGSTPTTNSYNCRSWESGNSESCAISQSQTGTYYVMIQSYSTFNDVSLLANYTEANPHDNPDGDTYTSNIHYPIPDDDSAGISSTISVTRTGDSGNLIAKLAISHDFIGDLHVEVHSPDGTISLLHDNTGGIGNNLNQSYPLDMTGVESAGLWTLKVVDSVRNDIGTINAWTLSFQ
ncbi:S8 family serine peptidase [Shewanella sp. VB17]|uniref:S8 family serine peptidase n=1 Tax=Shewanella sp. VB17 TaxID=2739432 RepID=UPI001563139D|nr:S8 family serine peptidase [Shewanella sp. VB17]NRD74388.1 S8 family serine peptidase [Shewanella sp. VB17]